MEGGACNRPSRLFKVVLLGNSGFVSPHQCAVSSAFVLLGWRFLILGGGGRAGGGVGHTGLLRLLPNDESSEGEEILLRLSGDAARELLRELFALPFAADDARAAAAAAFNASSDARSRSRGESRNFTLARTGDALGSSGLYAPPACTL